MTTLLLAFLVQAQGDLTWEVDPFNSFKVERHVDAENGVVCYVTATRWNPAIFCLKVK